jgi:CRP-like cAMP-binding protein
MQETIIANETCRVLTLPRDQWQSILSENPEGAKLVLANLQR